MKKILILLITISMVFACKNKSTTNPATPETTTTEVKKSENTTPKGTPMKVDVSKSKVLWTGTKPTGKHTGTINVSEGRLFHSDGKITGGTIVLDMNTINSTDLSGDYKADLEAHLKGTKAGEENDFFNVADFPTATINISKIIEVKNSTSTHMAMGNLTIKGITKAVGIPCNITTISNSYRIMSKGYQIDRTKWGINFMSKSIFPNIKDKFINDKIGVDIDIIAHK